MRYLTTLITLCLSASLFAQNAAFLREGSVTYEKKINVYALLDKSMNDNEWAKQFAEAYKKNNPQFKTINYTLNFDESRSLYQLENPNEFANTQTFNPALMLGNENIIHTDLNTGKSVTKRKFFEENFIVEDSTRKFVWKITDEYRDIAGFQCRRANGLMFDSVYVVAFFTNQIIPSVGPESFNGLPGTILGVALPHENVTWFATKVFAKKIPDEQLNFSVKGKRSTTTDMQKAINKVMEDAPEALRKDMMRRFML